MHRPFTTLTALIVTLPAFAAELPAGYVEIGRFTGTIDGTETTLIATAHPEGENSDMEYSAMFNQYTITAIDGFDQYATPKLPWLEFGIQPDPMGDDTETLRLDDMHLFIEDMNIPAYLAEVQSGFGTLAFSNLETRNDGYIGFDFTAEMPKAMMNDAYEVVPDTSVPPIHIEGHFEGAVPEWKIGL